MNNFLDMHMHLLPGVDDSFLQVEQMNEFFAKYAGLGFSHLYFTPHLYNPYVTTNIAILPKRFELAKQKAAEYGIVVSLGSEVYIREFEEYKVLPLDGRFVLCEFSTTMPPANLFGKLDALINKGFRIIFAHIERYNWFNIGNSFFEEARKRNILFQINAQLELPKKAQTFLDNGYVDFIASDNHGDLDKMEVLANLLNMHPEVVDRMNEYLLKL